MKPPKDQAATDPGPLQAVKVFPPAPSPSRRRHLLTAVIVLTILFTPVLVLYQAWAFSNLSYIVTDSALKLQFGWRQINVPLTDIENVVISDDLKLHRRVAGTSLAGYRSGWFQDAAGRIYLLATIPRPVVVIQTASKDDDGAMARRYGLTPAQPEQFVHRLQRAKSDLEDGDPAGGGQSETLFLPASGQGRSPTQAFSGLAVAVILISLGSVALIIFFVGGGPKHLRYEITPQGLTVVQRWSKQQLSWDNVQRVDKLTTPLRGIRLFGVALPGLYTGSFRFKDLGLAQVYATRLNPPFAALFTANTTWLLTPADVDEFLQAARDFMSSPS